MSSILLADIFYTETSSRTLLHAMPLLLGALCVLAIAYRYYSAFLAARVAALDDARPTPAHQFNDGQNYHPTNKWVLFGHHFAAISGAGPLIGPVLAIQYGYAPGLLWLVIGVCLAGAVQDMLVLAASVRRGGKSLAEIARTELGPWANLVVSAAILFIVVIALAGLGFVVVKALGGEEVNLAEGMQITLPRGDKLDASTHPLYNFPGGCKLRYTLTSSSLTDRSEAFQVRLPDTAEPLHAVRIFHYEAMATTGKEVLGSFEGVDEEDVKRQIREAGNFAVKITEADSTTAPQGGKVTLPRGCVQVVPGSSWGTFTIACTIPIALFVGLYMYRIRKGRVGEASLIGAIAVLAATVAGNWIPGSPLEGHFSLTKGQTTFALCAYGFIASVLPVWMLLCPRDYLSSFLKIGTIALLIVGVFVANPVLPCPPINPVFKDGGPTFPWGGIFPFVFICIMCGAISGFHALVSSGTTPKMVDKESQVRMIGYGAMLMEGLVGIVALVAAASLDPKLYYDINVDLSRAAKWQGPVDKLTQELGGVDSLSHLPVEKTDLAGVERMVGGEALRGRTGGAVTLAVGMAFILSDSLSWTGLSIDGIIKYWFHFAIMFEALFILTTIDTGTRIARFLLQEAMGKVHPQFEKTDWLPGAALSTLVVTAGWGLLVQTGSIDTIWPMFGIANQLLAVIALCLVTTLLINTGRARYIAITLVPMIFVTATTLTAGAKMIPQFYGFMELGPEKGGWSLLKGSLNIGLMIFVMTCVGALLLLAVSRWVAVGRGLIPVVPEAALEQPTPTGVPLTFAPPDGAILRPDTIERRH
jgi:carbon starvation protein